MANTEQILNRIDKEMSKMMGKSKTKMTNEEFRTFVTEQWELMGEDKRRIHDVTILIGRMMNEAVRANDPADLVKWIKEDQKQQKIHQNTPEQTYNYYANHFINCKAFSEGLSFFQNEQKSGKNTETASRFVQFFQEIINNPDKMKQFTAEADDKDDDSDYQSIELTEWQAFFDEKTAQIGYEILDEDGESTEKENEKHKNGLKYLKENQMLVLNNILSELLEQYPSLQEKYNYSDEDKADFMPDITDISGFAMLLSPTNMYVFSEYKDDFPYIGIGFSCSWDEEHGLGVVVHKDKVIKIGDASDAFLL